MRADISLELFLGNDIQILAKHIELLKAIRDTKSITKAAQVVGISYKNAWDSLDVINNKSHKPLVIRADGKKKNSGSELSQYGHKMIELFETLLNTQKEYLNKICQSMDIEELDIVNLGHMSMSLSARNQLSCEIVEINTGAVNTEVVARLNSGKKLHASITCESEKNLNLKVGKRVIFIFKAPSVMLCSLDDELKLSETNLLKGKVVSAKIGAVNAEITMDISMGQTITALISKDSAMEFKVGVGDEFNAVIKSSQIIIGV
ncbi:TOBE domain-containing protein [Campylobacter sp. 7477a]|uniref:TOBE domain-containing protein n=1 Tax=Campylobacter sp. 7477a TaxID=2735741 RepID=UPI00301521E9|nr:TOBE domain-containing protein [Campylobacter sp. 7477a]